ncbi:MAG: DMT family transporter [Candidatus Heimdallarchaeum aukensis]|uniref:DMT family transporter n=1 Tax=Candidatus Heimdallarchaeum aukensis TaxID=2876573 RepID=A0A9Y1FL26_9ARCH|nr:MAG: DMT family transporter [Candidatus Heimdallarchaeum aukensis]
MTAFALGIGLSFLAAFGWGIGFITYKLGVKSTDPLTATFLRGLVAIPLIITISVLLYGIESLTVFFKGEASLWLILSAITITLGDFFSLFSMKKLDASISQPISATYPLFTNIILLIGGIEKVTTQIIIGTLLNVIGAGIISFQTNRKDENGLEKSQEEKRNNLQGMIFAILAALAWGFTIVFTKILLSFDGINVIPMLGIRNGIMILIAGIGISISYLRNKLNKIDKKLTSKKDLSFLILGGIVTWGAGGISFFTAVTLIGAARSTPISSISPFFVLLLGSVFLKEKISKLQLLGVVSIVCGSILLSI